MTRLALFLLVLLLAPAALAQQATAPDQTTLQDKLGRLNRSLDTLLADAQRLDRLHRALDGRLRTLDAQLADPQRFDDLRRTLDGLDRTLGPQTPASRATPSPPRP